MTNKRERHTGEVRTKGARDANYSFDARLYAEALDWGTSDIKSIKDDIFDTSKIIEIVGTNDDITNEIYKDIKVAVESVNWDAVDQQAQQSQSINSAIKRVVPIFLGFNNLGLLAQIPMISQLASLRPRACVKNGWKLVSTSSSDRFNEFVSRQEHFDKKYKIATTVKSLLRSSLIYGGSLAFFDVFGAKYDEPANGEMVLKGFYNGIREVDPIRAIPVVTAESINPLSDYYYEPVYYQLVNTPHNLVHASHIAKIVPEPVIPYLKPTYRYMGLSMAQKVFPFAQGATDSILEIPKLLRTKRTKVFKTNTSRIFTNAEKFNERMRIMELTENNYGRHVIDNGGGDPAQAEEILQVDTSLAEVPSVVEKIIDAVGMASGDPITKITGRLGKGGLGSTGEFDLESWYEVVSETQELIKDLLLKHYEYCYRSEYGEAPPEFDVVFNPVETTSPKEKAEILSLEASYLSTLAQGGFITDIEGRTYLQQNELSGFNAITPEDIDEYENDLELESAPFKRW